MSKRRDVLARRYELMLLSTLSAAALLVSPPANHDHAMVMGHAPIAAPAVAAKLALVVTPPRRPVTLGLEGSWFRHGPRHRFGFAVRLRWNPPHLGTLSTGIKVQLQPRQPGSDRSSVHSAASMSTRTFHTTVQVRHESLSVSAAISWPGG